MTFGVTAIVPNPTRNLVRELEREDANFGVTEMNYLWVHLQQDLTATRQAYPYEWESEDSYRRKQLTVSHTLYKIPKPISARRINPLFHVEASEVSYPGITRIVADSEGGRLKPFMMKGEARSKQTWTHPTTAYFGGESLTAMTLHCGKDKKGSPYGSLSLRKAKIKSLLGKVLVTEESMLYLADPTLAVRKVLTLNGDKGKWDPMLKAMYSRQECSDRECRGHFVLD